MRKKPTSRGIALHPRVRLNVSLPVDDFNQFEALARGQGLTPWGLMRAIIYEKLEAMPCLTREGAS